MNDVLSPNTQTILLLTAPLLTGRGNKIGNLLTPGEYSKLARQLRTLEREPADLLTADANLLLEECDRTINKERLKSLLGRGFLLSLAVETLAVSRNLGHESCRQRIPATAQGPTQRKFAGLTLRLWIA